MHEFSISQSMADIVLKEAAKRDAKKILAVEIEIGELSLLNPQQVEFCLELLFEKTPASDAELKLELVQPLVLCQDCGYEGALEARDETNDDPLYHLYMPAFKCPRCGSPELSIKRGRECTVKRIEILA